MNGNDFKKDLANPKHVYCLISTDSAIIDLYVDRFKKAIKADNVSYGKIKSSGKLFKQTTLNVIYIDKLDETIFNIHEYIFIYTDSIDKRSKIYKNYKSQIIELSNNYIDYIMKHSNLSETEAIKFSTACNNDLGIIKNSLTIYKESDFCYNRFSDRSNNIYDWVDAYLCKTKLHKLNESPISVMALLSTMCNNILKIKNNEPINTYIKQCLYKAVKCNTEQEIISIINDCFYLDCQIKKGLINVDYVLQYLIVRRYNNDTSN